MPIYLAGVGDRPGTLPPNEPEIGREELPQEPEDCFEREAEGPQERTSKSSAWTLADIMSHPVLTARMDQSVREVVQLLAKQQIAGMPVVDEGERLVGVLSQSDVAAHVAHSWAEVPPSPDSGGFFQSLWLHDPNVHERMSAQTPVEHVMSPYVYYATPDTTLQEAADLMLEHNIHRIIVLRGPKIAGIVTSLDLLRAFRQLPGEPAGARAQGTR